jgi:branched-chain amino acid transport system substrate-binding protein
MLKRKIALGLSALLSIGILSGCGAKSSSSDEIKIGFVGPLTGEIATFGQSAKNALTILEEEANKNGGVLGKKIKFIYQDDEGKPAGSASVAQKLINNDKVVAIVGPQTSGTSSSVAPITEKLKVPMVTGSATNPKVTEAGTFTFRACFVDPFQGLVNAKFAAEDLKAKTAAVLFNNGDDYSSGLADNFIKNFEKLGGKVVASETYNKGDQDFNAQLTKIKPQNPDVLFLPDYYGTVALIAKQARSLGIQSTFMGGDGWDSEKLYEIGGTAVNGAYFSNHYSADDTSKEVTDFKKAYQAKFNSVPDTMAVLNYDAARIIIEAIKTAGKTDPVAIKDAIYKTNLTGVSGKITLDEKRNAVKSAVVVKVEGNKNTFVKRIQP